jgi:hypothetical protein
MRYATNSIDMRNNQNPGYQHTNHMVTPHQPQNVGTLVDSSMKVHYWRAFSMIFAWMMAWMFDFCFAQTPFRFVLLGR